MSKNVIINGIKTTKHEHVGGVVAYSVDGLNKTDLDALYLALCDKYYKVNTRIIANMEYNRFNGYIACEGEHEKIILEKVRVNMAEVIKK